MWGSQFSYAYVIGVLLVTGGIFCIFLTVVGILRCCRVYVRLFSCVCVVYCVPCTSNIRAGRRCRAAEYSSLYTNSCITHQRQTSHLHPHSHTHIRD